MSLFLGTSWMLLTIKCAVMFNLIKDFIKPNLISCFPLSFSFFLLSWLNMEPQAGHTCGVQLKSPPLVFFLIIEMRIRLGNSWSSHGIWSSTDSKCWGKRYEIHIVVKRRECDPGGRPHDGWGTNTARQIELKREVLLVKGKGEREKERKRRWDRKSPVPSEEQLERD